MGENSDKDIMVYDRFSCENCADNGKLDFDFTMAFQPIVNCRTKEVFAYGREWLSQNDILSLVDIAE